LKKENQETFDYVVPNGALRKYVAGCRNNQQFFGSFFQKRTASFACGLHPKQVYASSLGGSRRVALRPNR
jgi:hypothetical protein